MADFIVDEYPDARADVISGVNFTTHAGQMLGIIGSTGSGKSTLVQLIRACTTSRAAAFRSTASTCAT